MIPRPIASLLAAFTFLTRLPLPGTASVDQATLRRSAAWFPLVGAFVGGIGALALDASSRIWPPLVAATLSLMATVLLTGAFHEDALADTADGIGGGRDREHALEIMRDSRIGAYGAVALVLVLAARLGCLAALATTDRAVALVAAHALGRWSSLPLLAFLPYARPQGAGAPFAGTTPARVLAGTLLAAILVGLALGPRAPVAGVVAVVITAAAGGYFRSRLGGITGDCLGATNQVVELATYLVVLA